MEKFIDKNYTLLYSEFKRKLKDNKYSLRLFCHRTASDNSTINDYPPYYDFTIIIKGKFCYYINGEKFEITSGNGILIRPGDNRHLYSRDPNTHYFSVNFFSMNDEEIPLPRYIKNCATSDLRDLLRIFEHTLKKPLSNYKDFMIDNYVNLILLQLREITEENNMSPYLSDMLDYISNHYTERITLQDVANSVSLTPSYCCYLFKKELNTTIYDVIMKERILMAQNLIISTKDRLQDIGVQCGFNDYSHFSKYFKKVTGYLPSEYKKFF